MSSFTMSKAETVVLFDLLCQSPVFTGICDWPQIDKEEYEIIERSFLREHLLEKNGKLYRPDKALDCFLLPMIRANNILIVKYGVDEKKALLRSMYFAKNGLTVVYENSESQIVFLDISSFNDLLLFMHGCTNIAENHESFFSYIHLNQSFSIVHCTKIHPDKRTAIISEGKRFGDSELKESSFEVMIDEYNEMLRDKLQEVYNVIGS